MEEECERNVLTELTVEATYLVTSPLANTVIKTIFKQFVTNSFIKVSGRMRNDVFKTRLTFSFTVIISV